MDTEILVTTGGAWYIRHTFQTMANDHLTLTSTNDEIIATIPPRNGKPNYGDATLLAASKCLLDALIDISILVNEHKETYSIERINTITSEAFEKIHAEIA